MPPLDPRIAAYLAKNKQWAESERYKPPIMFSEMQKKGREREDGTVIVVACTDPRVTPEEFLGMSAESGNKATTVRTAGGRVHDAVSTLLVLSAVGNLGKKGTIMVVHHTDCGLCNAAVLEAGGDEGIRRALLKELETNFEGVEEVGEGYEEARKLEGMKFGSFVRPEDSVKEDVEFLRASPWFKGMQIVGFVQDTETGLLSEAVGP